MKRHGNLFGAWAIGHMRMPCTGFGSAGPLICCVRSWFRVFDRRRTMDMYLSRFCCKDIRSCLVSMPSESEVFKWDTPRTDQHVRVSTKFSDLRQTSWATNSILRRIDSHVFLFGHLWLPQTYLCIRFSNSSDSSVQKDITAWKPFFGWTGWTCV